MSDMRIDNVFAKDSDAELDRQWTSEHPVWARIGAFMERVAEFCGTHAAGYIVPAADDRRLN
ncbi:hypothetical protein ACS8Y6_10055 [Salinisphaera sp. RV14]|uniref:hypothetical protein n=1 Tax=Salinisphaera sp. RV14 TaxID=3454140 RepID=UPI003F855BAD